MQPAPNLRSTEKPMPVQTESAADHWVRQHRLQIEDFVESVLEDRDPFITGEMGLEPLKVILAIYESARQDGERVTLREFAEEPILR